MAETKMTHADVLKALQDKFGAEITGTKEFRGELTVTVSKSALHQVLLHCRDGLAFDYLVDITTVDHLGQDPRFECNYELYSYGSSLHLRIKSLTSEDEADFPSACDIWSAANWHEREAWDMMGVKFTNHPDLRRILMWEGYPYFPLRKEFPLAGKESELPDVAFTGIAPLEGGPFVTSPGAADTIGREPRSKGV